MSEQGFNKRFEMVCARGAADAGLSHLALQISALEQAIWQQPNFAFDLAKFLVEDVCKSILIDRSVAFAKRDDLPKLYRAVIEVLPLLPPAASAESESRESLKKLSNGLISALYAMCELRSAQGFASHAAGTPHAEFESIQALLVA